MKVSDIIGEPIVVHRIAGSRAEYREQTADLLRVVGLEPSMGDRYPHEFSGGQRQRMGVARALAVKPSFIVCDEPVSALDVSIQAQIIDLLEDLQERFNLTYLFFAHDLALVRHISDRIAVMYLGELVEVASRMDLYHNPLHPYTRALLSAVPIANPSVEAHREHIFLKGEVPSPPEPAARMPFSSPVRFRQGGLCRAQAGDEGGLFRPFCDLPSGLGSERPVRTTLVIMEEILGMRGVGA